MKQEMDEDSLEERAYQAVKKAIIDLELKPGTKISQNEWAERLAISRTPVREALKRLFIEGFVTLDASREWRVYELDLDAVRKLYELKEGIEGMMARLAAVRMTGEKTAELEAVIARMAVAVAADDKPAFRREDSKLHAVIEALADNPYLAAASARANEMLARLRREKLSLPGRIARSLEENRRIVEALAARDPDAAERAQHAHLKASAETFIMVLEELVVPLVGPHF